MFLDGAKFQQINQNERESSRKDNYGISKQTFIAQTLRIVNVVTYDDRISVCAVII